MTRISIVTIAWNDLAGLKRTFASLANQTYAAVEHLIIDGGSTDGSVEWLHENRVFADTVIVSEHDDGIFDAMNKGLGLATGEVIYFLNAGDCLASNAVLEIVASSYDQEGWQWAFGLSQMVDESFLPTRRRTKPKYSWVHKTFWRYDISHQAVFMRTQVLRQAGGFDLRYAIAADYLVLTKLGHIERPKVLPVLTAITLEGGLSGASMATTYWECHRARAEILKMGRLLAWCDGGLTAMLIVKANVRRFVREQFIRHVDRRPLWPVLERVGRD